MKSVHIALVILFGLPLVAFANPISVGTSQDGLFAVDKQANLWGTNYIEGDFAEQVVKFSGNRSQFIRTAYSSSFVKNLKPKGSNITHNVDGHIEQVWPLPDGMVLFTASVNGKSYLYKLNPTANSVGNNYFQKYTNKQAVMNIGERYSSTQRKNIHYPDVRALHERSLLVATIAGKTVLFFGDYNVNADRVGGGAGDAVALWRSNDMGNTWTRAVEWNTNGIHQVDHIHGLRQNPYNGWIYILFGDDNSEPGIVAWNGISKPVPYNTPLATIGLNNKYPGWRALSGSQDVRTGDIVFTPNKCVWIPDVDYLSVGELLYSQQANHDLTGLQATGLVPYVNGLPAIIGERDSSGTIYWASFRSSLDYSQSPPVVTPQNIHLWTSTDSGLSWQQPLSLGVYNDWTSVPQSLFVAPWGELVVGGRDLTFVSGGNDYGSSVYLKR